MRRCRTARGTTLTELLVGLAIGLTVTAAAATLWSVQIHDDRRRAAEARLTDDLRAALDLATRDLRRAGYWGAAAQGLPAAGATGAPAATNPYTAVTPADGSAAALAYRYSLDAVENGSVDGAEQFGFRLRGGVLEAQLGSANWQALTDTGSSFVTAFQVTSTSQVLDLGAFCRRPCAAAAAAADCPPRQQLRSIDLALAARLPDDARVARRLEGRVLLRNPSITGRCSE